MASELAPTAVEGGEGKTEDSVDYVTLLRDSLEKQNLLYIADIVMEVEQESLADLLEYSRTDITESLADIHNDKDNDYKIKATHRNKFAKTVVAIAAQRKEALEKQTIAPSATSKSTSQVKLLFLGKEEEEAIESIQSGQQFMEKYLAQMQESFNNLDEKNKNLKKNLDKICNSLKQQIDEKQKQMISKIDTVYEFHLKALNERNKIAQHSAKVVTKFYSDYESYFTDNKLSKSDRKNKLISAKISIATEVNKLEKYPDIAYEIDIALDKCAANEFVNQSVSLNTVGILPVINATFDGFLMKWQSPDIKGDMINMLKANDDDNKEQNELDINYEILYRKIDENENDNDEKKQDEEWNRIRNLGNINEYDMGVLNVSALERKIKYNINNVWQSPESAVLKAVYTYCAKWSSIHKGSGITLSDDNIKAIMSTNNQSVRAEYPVRKGTIVTLNFTFHGNADRDMFGVISSEYVGNCSLEKNAMLDSKLAKYCYGLHSSNSNSHYYGTAVKNLGWTAGKVPENREVIIQMIVNYKTYNECCLTYYIDGNKKGPTNADYSMKLPPLKAGHKWYPMVQLDYKNNWCRIELG